MTTDTKKRIEQLRVEIRRHDYLYYVLNQPEISDQQYDKLFAELKALERQHPRPYHFRFAYAAGIREAD